MFELLFCFTNLVIFGDPFLILIMAPKEKAKGKFGSPPLQSQSQRTLRVNREMVDRYDGISRTTCPPYLVMYGIDDKKVFVAHIGNKSLFETEGISNSTMVDRRQWNIGEEVMVNFNGNAVSCKLAEKCFTEKEARAAEKKQIDQFNLESNIDEDEFNDLGDNDEDRGEETSEFRGGEAGRGRSDDEYESDSDEGICNQRSKRYKATYEKRQAFELAKLQNVAQATPVENPQEQEPIDSGEMTQVRVLHVEIKEMLGQLHKKVDDLARNQQSNARATWRAIRAIEKRLEMHNDKNQQVLDQNEAEAFFTADDKLIWMGQDMSDYFNSMLQKFNGDLTTFLTRIALEMWGDRVCYHFFVPSSRLQSGKQRRQLLQSKDRTGVDCLEKIMRKILLEKERARIMARSQNKDEQYIRAKMDDYVRTQFQKDRTDALLPINQLGQDFTKRKNVIPKAKYYELIENGHVPYDQWSMSDEAYEDSVYREKCTRTGVKEESEIIKVGQELFDAGANQEKRKAIEDEYSVIFPFMRF